MNDPMVRRVNALVTTFLDLLATLLFAGAAGWAAWALAVAAVPPAWFVVFAGWYALRREGG